MNGLQQAPTQAQSHVWLAKEEEADWGSEVAADRERHAAVVMHDTEFLRRAAMNDRLSAADSDPPAVA
jgi:hypothetical protein